MVDAIRQLLLFLFFFEKKDQVLVTSSIAEIYFKGLFGSDTLGLLPFSVVLTSGLMVVIFVVFKSVIW